MADIVNKLVQILQQLFEALITLFQWLGEADDSQCNAAIIEICDHHARHGHYDAIEFDMLVVTGSAQVDGNSRVQVRYAPTATLAPGDSVVVLRAANVAAASPPQVTEATGTTRLYSEAVAVVVYPFVATSTSRALREPRSV